MKKIVVTNNWSEGIFFSFGKDIEISHSDKVHLEYEVRDANGFIVGGQIVANSENSIIPHERIKNVRTPCLFLKSHKEEVGVTIHFN